MKTTNFFRTIMVSTMVVCAMAVTSCDNGNEGNGTIDPPVDNELSGSITDSKTLDAEITYKLTGPLLVEDGGKLTIPAGTTIEAKKGFSSYILVLQGGQIFINGTAEKPVTMTLDMEVAGTTTADRWGGLVVNGLAPLEDAGLVGSTEISSAYAYGGDNPSDNSGVITYLKLLYTGESSSANVEHNGLTLNGVGSGTRIENIFVKDGSDDGIEFFGGSVNVKNILVVNSDDDMFDFTRGYCGKVENAYGVWEAGFSSTESDPSGIEADGNFDGEFPDAPDQSNFTVENMTIELRGTYDEAKFMQNVLRVRRHAIAHVINALVKGTGCAQNLVNLEGGSTGGADVDSEISITNQLDNEPTANTIKVNSDLTADDYTGVAIEEGNTGCARDIFDWTGYQF